MSRNRPRPVAHDKRLRALGWTASLEREAATFPDIGCRRARVTTDFGVDLAVRTASGEERARLSAALYRDARGGNRVVVGDWVLLAGKPGSAEIVRRLERRSKLSRRRPGPDPTAEQVIAANVDVAFIVTEVADVNLRRIERYIALVCASDVEPVILLSKIDAGVDARDQIAQLSAAAPGVPVHLVSSKDGQGLDEIVRYLRPGRTICLLGSSGVGKSTLVNRLSGGEQLKTQATRPDGTGRHTTTHRELVPLPTGALLIDNPGLREVGLAESQRPEKDAFSDISALADECRFRDCSHDAEPSCAVREAAETGALSRERLANFRTLAHEQASRKRAGAAARAGTR